jgi:hypothetical protein
VSSNEALVERVQGGGSRIALGIEVLHSRSAPHPVASWPTPS